MIAAGKLRHRITIQELSAASPDVTGSGMPDESWVDVASVDASIEHLSGTELYGTELYAAQEHHAEVTTRITIRYRSGINAKQRIVFRGKIYNIKSAPDFEERRRVIKILATEGVNEG
jgi:SPP1 family predicted phage head-tail adaptor